MASIHDQAPEALLRLRRLVRLSERDPRRAVSLARRMEAQPVSADPVEAALGAFGLGYALLRWERVGEALPLLERVCAQFQQLGLAELALQAERARLAAALILGEGAELQEQWEHLALSYERLGLALEACRARFDQIGHLNALGHPREALALIERIRPAVEQEGGATDQARLLRLTAVACRLDGLLDPAYTAIQGAIDGYRAAGAIPDLAKSLFERSIIYQRRDEFELALADLDQARRIFDRLQMSLWEAYCAMDSGLIASRLGRYDQGIAATFQARRQLEVFQRRDHMASCDLNLANIAYYCGLFDLAIVEYQRAEAVFLALDRSLMALICRRNQALTLSALGQQERALILLAEISVDATRLGEGVELAEAALTRGQVLVQINRYDEGSTQLDTAEQLFREQGNTPMAAVCRLEKGWLYLAQGDLAAAYACLQSIGDSLSNQPAYAWRAVYGLGRYLDLEGRADEALAKYRAAGAIICGLRRRLVSEHASSGIFRQAEQFLRDALGLAQQLNAPQAALELVEDLYAVALDSRLRRNPFVLPAELEHEFAQRQAELRQLIDEPPEHGAVDAAVQRYVELLLRAQHQKPLDDPVLVATFDLQLIRQRCNTLFPAGWSILTYVQQQADRLLVIGVDAASTWIETIALDESLRKALGYATKAESLHYTFLDLPYLNGDAPQRWDILERLGAAIIPARLRPRLHPDHRLLIVPSGLLQHLAWPALRVDGSWLVECAVVQLVPSLQVWLALLERSAASAEALLLGSSRFEGLAPDLPNVGPSLDLVEQSWAGAVTRVEDRALTRSWLLESAALGRLGAYGLIHIATHGQLVASKGLLAHLKLGREYLFYDDVAQLRLAGALVVLAACEGASAEVLPGEEVISLSRAFLAAGARDVIASSWPIYDNEVLRILRPLYACLVRGADAPTALALAQRGVISSAQRADADDLMLGSPLIWAGLVALGAGTVSGAQRGVPAPLLAIS